MPFVAHKVELKAMAGGTGLSVSLRKPKSGPAKMTVCLSLAKALQLGWEAGDKLEVLVGTEEQHGLVRLHRHPEGTAVLVGRNAGRRGAYYGISLGHIPGYVDRTEEKRYCQFEVLDDGWIEIILPKWADETHPTKKVVRVPEPLTRAPVVVERRPPLGQRTRPVPIAGDPPRERSALNNRAAAEAEAQRLRRAEEEGRRESEALSREIRREERPRPGGRAITLAPTDRKLLAVLIDAQNHTIGDLAEQLGVAKSSVQPYVSNLRRKLTAMAISVETVPGGGFGMKPEMAAKAREFLSVPA